MMNNYLQLIQNLLASFSVDKIKEIGKQIRSYINFPYKPKVGSILF
jgi:hypothetical protein